jgi:signal transduction histidine kinase
MRSRRIRRWIILSSAVLGGLVVLSIALWQALRTGLPYHDSFSVGRMTEWESYDGTWSVAGGAARNDSDDRGAKFMTGSPNWRDYSVEADVELLGRSGDAGLVVRATDEEQGIDSYRGYYAGLRVPDGTLIIGRANYGWAEYQNSIMPGGIEPFRWYHVKVVAYGCTVAASAVNPNTGTSTITALEEDLDSCARTGRIGLRSFMTGGIWKNVHVVPAAEPDLLQLRGRHDVSHSKLVPLTLQEVLDGCRRALRSQLGRPSVPRVPAHTEPIRNLLVATPMKTSTVSVRGSVILTNPAMYVEDSTGGVSIPETKDEPLKVGDEVEVTGIVRPNEFSTTMMNATVRLLWAGTPSPPLAITVSQAATGAFDARFVELEAFLDSVEETVDKSLILSLHDNGQHFRAILNGSSENQKTSSLTQGSRLRVRGVCVASPEYTNRLTPFVVLLRSMGDVQRVAGPPWWSKRNLIAIGSGFIFFSLLAYMFYIRAEQWRLRAILQERQRLAHELHDTLAQSFAGIGFQLRAIAKRMPRDLQALHEQLKVASQLVAQGHQEARRSISMLRPGGLDSIELLPALAHTAQAMVAGGPVTVDVMAKGSSRQIPLKVADVLYRVGVEAIANAIRHAQATHIGVVAEYKAQGLILTVEDNGIGFVPEEVSEGFGLSGMTKRVESVGGAICINSVLGAGTSVKVAVSLPGLFLSGWLSYRKYDRAAMS